MKIISKLLIIFLLSFITNFIFAQNVFDKVTILDGIDETNEYLKANNSSLVLYQTKLITQNAKIGRRVSPYQDNKYIIFRDSLGNVHKKIALTDCTYGVISHDYKNVMLNTGNHPMYTLSFINQYYDYHGNLLFEQESGYRLNIGEIGNFYSIQDASVQDDCLIFDSKGNKISSILDGMLGSHIYAGGNSNFDFKIFDSFKEGKCLIALDKNGHIVWQFKIANQTTKQMIKINPYLKRIFIGSSNDIFILDYSGNILNKQILKYDYGSYVNVSKNGKYLAALNVKARRKSHFLFLIDEETEEVLINKKLAEANDAKILQVKVNDNGIVLITYSDNKYFKKTLMLLDKNGNILINYNYKNLLTPDLEFAIINIRNGFLLFNGRNALALENKQL